jgi:hypothetical protein
VKANGIVEQFRTRVVERVLVGIVTPDIGDLAALDPHQLAVRDIQPLGALPGCRMLDRHDVLVADGDVEETDCERSV